MASRMTSMSVSGRSRQHRRLVHADTDRANDSACSEVFEHGIRLIEGRLPVLVWVVDVDDVDPGETEALEARFNRSADTVRRVVEDHPTPAGIGVIGVGPLAQRLTVDLVALAHVAGRPDQPADLGREHELIARASRQRRSHGPFRGAIAVERGDVEIAHAERPGVIDDRHRVPGLDRLIQPADRGSAKGEPGHGQRRPSERHPIERLKDHEGEPSR